MSSTPGTLWLSNATYINEKRRITVEFSNKETKITKNYDFYPVMFISKSDLNEKMLYEKINLLGVNSFNIIQNKETLKIIGKNYSKLKELQSYFLRKETFLIEPERQFLLLNNWSYFDAFTFDADIPNKQNTFLFPSLILEFFGNPLDSLIATLRFEDKKAARQLTRCLLLSNLLSVSFQKVPLKKRHQLETLVENSLFLQEKVFIDSGKQRIYFRNETVRGNFKNLLELDFSSIWPEVIMKKNIGSEMENCKCCKPESIYSENISTNSLVSVEFLEDAFYYDSNFAWFSNKYHMENTNKDRRLLRMREFFTKNIPVGPFFQNEIKNIPIDDAKQLEKEGFARILPVSHQIKWFCMNEKTVLSSMASKLILQFGEINSKIGSYEKLFFDNFKLNGLHLLENDLNYAYLKQYAVLISSIFKSMPQFLLDPKNQYYSYAAAESFRSLQHSLIAQWKEMMEKEGTRVIAIDSFCNKIFVEGAYLKPEFFKEKGLLLPVCLKHHSEVYF